MARYRDSIPNTSWKNFSDPVSSEGGFSGSPNIDRRTDWRGVGDAGSSFLKSYLDREKERDSGAFGKDSFGSSGAKAFGGEWSRSGSGQVLDNLGVVYPQQFSPMYIPGQPGTPGKKGLFGDIGGAAGMLGTAFGVFGPLGAPIGALAGSFVDRATS